MMTDDSDFISNAGLMLDDTMHRPYRGALGQHNGHIWDTTNDIGGDSDDSAQPKRKTRTAKKKKKKGKNSDGESEEEGNCEVLKKGQLLEVEDREATNVACAMVIPTHEYFKLYGEDSASEDDGGDAKGTEKRRRRSQRRGNNESDGDSDGDSDSRGGGEAKEDRRKRRNRK